MVNTFGDFYFYSFLANTPDLVKSVRQNLKIQRGKFTYYFLIYKGLR